MVVPLTFEQVRREVLLEVIDSYFCSMDKTSIASLILRLAGGGMMLTHGWPKLMKVLEGNWKFGNPLGIGEELSLALAVFAEFFCSILVIVGFKTRLSSIPLAFTMLVAAFIVHIDDPWKKTEFPLLYLAIFLSLILIGGGKYSLDNMVRSK